jgi:hypothetical protein
MKDLKSRFPLNLQFFAEPANEPTEPVEPTNEPTPTEPTNEPKEPTNKEKEPSLQELLIENAKLKRAQEKAASEAAEYKKKYNATLTEKEKASIEKAEQEAKKQEEYNNLVRENRIFKLEKEYLGVMKYTASEAQRMAVAEVDDDKEAKIKILAEVDARKHKEYEAEFLKNRPQVQAGTNNNDNEDLFIKAFNSVTPRFKR